MNNIAILASGSGSNAEAISRHLSDVGTARVSLILSDNPNAYVHKRARGLDIPSTTFSLQELGSGRVLELLQQHSIRFVALAGFLRLIPRHILDAYPNRVVNIHPALLPNYGGKGMYGQRVHAAVIAAGEGESGITIHYVNERYDEGSIIFQATCPVLPDDTPETLALRIHALEHEHYPRVIEGLLAGL